MVWVVIACAVLGFALCVGFLSEEIGQFLLESGVKLPRSLYMKRGRALYLPLAESGAKMSRHGDEVRVHRNQDELPVTITVRQHHAPEHERPAPSYLALELRFEVAHLGDAQAQINPLVCSTSRTSSAMTMLDDTWREQCARPAALDTIFVRGLGDGEQARREMPWHLTLALLLAHRDLDTLDALTQSPLSPADRKVSTCQLTGVERMRSTLHLTYHGQFNADASPQDEQRIVQTLLDHARYLARGLGVGGLMERCVEHLEFPHDDPPGIKSLSAQVLADQLGKSGDWPDANVARQRFMALVWQDQARFRLCDMVEWIGPHVIQELDDEQLLAHGRNEASDVLHDVLIARRPAIKLLNDPELCWALREKVLRGVLQEDEGLALHGPPMLKSLSQESLAMCLGFLARQASPLLWRAPWFIKQIQSRLMTFDATGWSALYESVLGQEVEFGDAHSFTSTRIARDVIFEASSAALEHRPDAFRSAELMHYQVVSFMARRAGSADLSRWQRLIDGLGIEQIDNVLRQSWLWDGKPFLFMAALSARPGFSQLVQRYPASFELMLSVFDIAYRRQQEPIDLRALHELIVQLEQATRGLMMSRHEELFGLFVRAFTEQAEAQGVGAEAVTMLGELAERAVTTNQANMMHYTIKVWVNGLKEQHLMGAITHVEARAELAGGLSLDGEAVTVDER